MRWGAWPNGGACKKIARPAFFSLDLCARFAYKSVTEAIKPGFEELAR